MKSTSLFKLLLLVPLVSLNWACVSDPTAAEEVDPEDEQLEQRDETGAEAFGHDDMNLQNFATEAASINMAEIKMSEMALEKSSDEEITNLAQLILNDHRQMQQKLSDIAQAKGWEMPSEPLAKQQDKIAQLQNSDENFDRRFVQIMISGHQEAVKKFSAAHGQAEETDEMEAFEDWIDQSIPLLNKHLKNARLLKDRM